MTLVVSTLAFFYSVIFSTSIFQRYSNITCSQIYSINFEILKSFVYITSMLVHTK